MMALLRKCKSISVMSSLLLLISSFSILLVSAAPASASVQATYYASPTGSGSTCTEASPCSLSGVQSKVKSVNANMTGDIVVNLLGGEYKLSSAWQLSQLDSGTNGFNVIYQANSPTSPPIISGGQTITGWSLYDSGKNIYRSYVGTSLNTRELYVNGIRAIRARGEDNPAGFTKTAGGFTAPSTGTYANMSTWRNLSNVEIVGYKIWKMFRCNISSVSGSAITMQNNCWNNAQLHPANFDSVTWVENAYELLDAQGEWYLDRTAGYLYYIPRSGETMNNANVVAPVLESLMNVNGTLDSPVHNIQFSGITFQFSTWLTPSTSEGYSPLQAGFTFTGVHTVSNNGEVTKTPGAVTFHSAKSIVLKDNTFQNLGGAGLVFEHGSQSDTILGNVFSDISSTAIQIGDVTDNDANPLDIRDRVDAITIKNNYITNASAEYYDAVGIFAGYTSNLTITHNEVSNLHYTAISVGWGWGALNSTTYAANNQITYNRIHDFFSTLDDGGGIYVLSKQANSTISNNYIYNMIRGTGPMLYLDNGTEGFSVNNNVTKSLPRSNSGPYWLAFQDFSPPATNNTAANNYTDTSSYNCCGSNTVTNTTVISDGVWPAAAQSIMNHAGLEGAYQNIKAGFYNVAQNKASTASSVLGTPWAANNANDDDKSSGWSPTGTDSMPWWQVDLGKEYPISQIQFVTRQDLDQAGTRNNFEIRASNDPSFATYTVLGSQGSVPLPYQATWTQNVSDPTTYRYIRVAKTVSEYFWISELQVNVQTKNLALFGTGSASSVLGTPYSASKPFDNDKTTGWSPTGTDPLPWWQVDLGASHGIVQIDLVTRQDTVDYFETRRYFEIRASNDPSFATYTVLGSQGSTPLSYLDTMVVNITDPGEFRYIRVAKTFSEYFWITELYVIGY